LPDTIAGLAELFYSQIDMEVPLQFEDPKKADDIEIKISKGSERGHEYYNITWNKPWEASDVAYTLVAYDEQDYVLGAIKRIDGDENASAIIGSPVITTANSYYWVIKDYWTSFDMLRFRVIVNFPDGTASVSIPLDLENKIMNQ
jgi:hypothetical protein